MTDPGASPASAEDVFAAFLERHEAGTPVAFASVLDAHPALADELRRVHSRWLAMSEAFAALSSRGEAGSDSAPESAQLQELMVQLRQPRERTARYALGAELGRGAMGRVLAARDQELRRDVAIKVLRGEPGNARQERRFLEEAQITGQLDHPGIVPIHELGLDREGRLYFAMRLVQGRDLGRVFALVATGAEDWTRTRALNVLLRVCEAMVYAHSKGVIHRDLKPGNIMVGRFGETYVMDWGLARVLGREDLLDPRQAAADPDAALQTVSGDLQEVQEDSPLLTRDGEVVGTPADMAPEQARGALAEVDARADVYAVGAMLYHLLMGHMPYVAAGDAPGSAQALLARVLAGPPPAVQRARADVPAELVAICERAMARDVAARYASMEALAADLRAYLEVRVVRAYEGGRWAELRKWLQRNRGLTTAAACGALALVLGLVTSTLLYLTAEGHRQRADANAARLAKELDQSEFERARMALRLDDAGNAENWIWGQFLQGRNPRAAHWALWELYSRSPCLATAAAAETRNDVVAFAPGSGTVVSAGADGHVRVAHADTLEPQGELGNVGCQVYSVASHAAAGLLLTGAEDGQVSLWNVAPPGLQRRVQAHRGAVRAVAACPGTPQWASGGEDGRVLLWSAPASEPQELLTHPRAVRALCFSAGGRYLASGDVDGGIRVTELGPRKTFALNGAWREVMGMSFAPDESELWTGGADHRLRVWNLESQTCVATLSTFNATCRALLHLDAATVLVGGWWRIDRWATATRQRTAQFLSGVWSMDHDARRGRLVAAGGGAMRVFDLADTARIELPKSKLAVSASGTRLAVVTPDRRIVVRELPSGAVVRDFGTPLRGIQRIELDAAGRRVLAVVPDNPVKVCVLDVESGRELLRVDGVREPPFQESYCLTPDGSELAVVHGAHLVQRFEVATGRMLSEWPAGDAQVLRLRYSADGRCLAAVTRRSTAVRLWSTADGQCRDVPVSGNPACIALAPDGQRLAVGQWNGKIQILDLRTQRTVMVLEGGAGTVWSLVWSAADPQLLLCAGGSGAVTLWDLDTGRSCLLLDPRVVAPVRCLSLSDDGQSLAMSGEEGAALVDLTYYERHTAGNLGWQMERLGENLGLSAARRAELTAAANAVLARPWPRLQKW